MYVYMCECVVVHCMIVLPENNICIFNIHVTRNLILVTCFTNDHEAVRCGRVSWGVLTNPAQSRISVPDPP